MKGRDFSQLRLDVGEGIYLRPIKSADVDSIFETVRRNQDHLMEFMHWMTPAYSRKSAQEYVERTVMSAANCTDSLGLGIFRDTQFIGSTGFVSFDFEVGKTEIGYWIDRGEQGKGIVTACAKRQVDFAFDELGINRIEIRCSTLNVRSAAIARRLGFKQEGLLRQCELRHGKLHDFYIFGLLRSEWNA